MSVTISFIAFLLLFVGVGIYSASRKKNTTTDYLLASRNVGFRLTALSAFATAHSGYMFTGLIGYTYIAGISAIWLIIGSLIGDTLAWTFVYKPLRTLSEKNASETVGAFLANNQKKNRWISIISTLIILIFVGAYASAQLMAGSKALSVLFNWDYNWNIIVGATVVLLYCFSGGIRASIWTDAVQSVVMIFAMIGLLIIAVIACGGVGALWSQLESADPLLVDLTPSNLKFGVIGFLLGWLGSGMAIFGQPHIIVRAMVIDSAKHISSSRNLYIFFYAVFAFAAIGVGLTARVLMPQLMEVVNDREMALPLLSLQLLPGVFVGIILAGLFAAVISTIDSQVLSCSAALTQDLLPLRSKSYKMAKVGTLVTIVLITAMALMANRNVFSLVNLAWAALGATIGPLVVVRAWQLRMNCAVGVIMMLTGTATTLIWRFGLNLSGYVSEALPGIVMPVFVYLIYRICTTTRK